MTRRRVIFILFALLLALLNVWQWRRAPDSDGPTASARPMLRAQDFRLKTASTPLESSRRGRDLFHRRLPVARAAIKKVEPAPPPPPQKTPEELAREAARAELGQIKLVGVVFRGQQGEAFVVVRDQLYTVRPGEKIGARFEVEALSQDSMRVQDPLTRVGGQIAVSGR